MGSLVCPVSGDRLYIPRMERCRKIYRILLDRICGYYHCLCRAAIAIDAVSAVDDKIKTQTLFIKSLTVDAESLVTRAKGEAVKAECKKVYEAVRYSDPMSNSALDSLENEITIKFSKLSDAVSSDNSEVVTELADTLVILIGERNKKCKLLK